MAGRERAWGHRSRASRPCLGLCREALCANPDMELDEEIKKMREKFFKVRAIAAQQAGGEAQGQV
jgi:hypothetical protein